MRWRLASVPLLIALLIGACGGSEQSPRESRPPPDPSTPALRDEQPPSVTLRLDRDKVEAGDELEAIMEWESGTFLVGNPYTFERLVGDKWLPVPPSQSGPMTFTLEGLILRPGTPFKTQISVPPSLPVGRYRVTKTAEPVTEPGEPTGLVGPGEPIGPTQQVSATFRVVSPSN